MSVDYNKILRVGDPGSLVIDVGVRKKKIIKIVSKGIFRLTPRLIISVYPLIFSGYRLYFSLSFYIMRAYTHKKKILSGLAVFVPSESNAHDAAVSIRWCGGGGRVVSVRRSGATTGGAARRGPQTSACGARRRRVVVRVWEGVRRCNYSIRDNYIHDIIIMRGIIILGI